MPNGNGGKREHAGRPAGTANKRTREMVGAGGEALRARRTDYVFADFFGVDTVTIHCWRNTQEEFCNAVTRGNEKADERVARSLFNRADNYTLESDKVFQFQGEVIRADTVEHVPPDPGAAAELWLMNLCPEEWGEKQEVDHQSSDGL